jgi:TPR repeat protein
LSNHHKNNHGINNLQQLQQDAEAGVAPAQLNLALYHLEQLDQHQAAERQQVKTQTIEKVVHWLEQAKSQQLAQAYFLHALLSMRGVLAAPNRDAAKNDLIKAHELGHTEAAYQLGELYSYWHELEDHFILARSAFKQAAELKNPEGLMQYAYALEHGAGGEQDLASAWHYWCQASNLGQPRALFRVADALDNYLKLPEHNLDSHAALINLTYQCFTKAAAQQYPAAAARAGQLKSQFEQQVEQQLPNAQWAISEQALDEQLLATLTSVMPLIKNEYQAKPIKTAPRITEIEGFLNADECSHLAIKALPYLQSSVVLDKSGQPIEKAIRTSEEMSYIDPRRDLVVAHLEARIAEFTQIPVANGEPLVVLKYAPGKEYKVHVDYFRPDLPSAKVAFQFGGQRIATFICYLNDVVAGGETVFPNIDLTIKPAQGKALLFYNVNEQGDIEPLSRHAGLPVIEGNKWIITRWLRENSLPIKS